MLISLCSIAYNEEDTLEKLFEDFKKQTYPKKKTEIVLIDNLSTDKTISMMEEFKRKHEKNYYGIIVKKSPRNLQAVAWNCALKECSGDIIVRVDAHASIPENFLENNAKHINNGEYICGGGRPSRISKDTKWQNMLLAAEESFFGGNIVKYRRTQKKKIYVDSVFHGAYRREVFEKVGGFDERLGRTEDNELHYRMRDAGYKICCAPDIISYQNVRPSLKGMVKQKFSNGFWIGLTTAICSKCLSIYHFAPFFLLCFLIAAAIVAGFGFYLPLFLLCMLYSLFDFCITISAFISFKINAAFLLLPLIFPFLHLAYGLGTFCGFLNLPFWKRKIKKTKLNSIEEVKNAMLLKKSRQRGEMSADE